MSGLMGNVKSTVVRPRRREGARRQGPGAREGRVPGPANGLVLIKGSVKDVKKYVVPRAIKEVESKNPMKASKKGARRRAAAKPAKK